MVAGESQADEEGKEGKKDKKDEEAVVLVKKEEPVGPVDELDGIVAMEDDEQEKPVKPTPAALTPEDKAMVDMLLKSKQQELLDEYRDKIQDDIRFWEAGWKDRYYADKYKEADITKGGGRERVFREYVMGLCWVMKYYYAGCASWKW